MKAFKCSKYALPRGEKTYIMGILNVTPDSFSDGGRYFDRETALRHAFEIVDEGADILDIGAVSTRPFSKAVSPDEEWERLADILPVLTKEVKIPISVDTYNTSTAEKSLNCGADIINDVSGIYNSQMAGIIKSYGAGWILMHGGIKINKAEDEICYSEGIVKSVNNFFEEMLEKINDDGIDNDYICLDPGFGFAKDVSQNTELLKNSDKLNTGGCPLLCALSRKRFVGYLSKSDNAEERFPGTLAANFIAVEKGADIIRVHDVKYHREAFNLYDKIIRQQ